MNMRDLELHGLLGKSGGGLWLFDWSSFQTVYNWAGNAASTPANSYRAVVDITGAGVLEFARGYSTATQAGNPSVRITIDGVARVFDGIDAGASAHGNMLMFPLIFKTSLKIEVHNRDMSTARNVGCDYTYLLQTRAPDPTKNTIMDAGSRKMAYAKTASTSLSDVVNITGSGYILYIEQTYFHAGTATGNTAFAMTIDGSQKSNRGLVVAGVESTKLHMFKGPIRFEAGASVSHALSNTGFTCITKVGYLLD